MDCLLDHLGMWQAKGPMTSTRVTFLAARRVLGCHRVRQLCASWLPLWGPPPTIDDHRTFIMCQGNHCAAVIGGNCFLVLINKHDGNKLLRNFSWNMFGRCLVEQQSHFKAALRGDHHPIFIAQHEKLYGQLGKSQYHFALEFELQCQSPIDSARPV